MTTDKHLQFHPHSTRLLRALLLKAGCMLVQQSTFTVVLQNMQVVRQCVRHHLLGGLLLEEAA